VNILPTDSGAAARLQIEQGRADLAAQGAENLIYINTKEQGKYQAVLDPLPAKVIKFLERHDIAIPLVDIRDDKKAMSKLWKESNRVKSILSANTDATITVGSSVLDPTDTWLNKRTDRGFGIQYRLEGKSHEDRIRGHVFRH